MVRCAYNLQEALSPLMQKFGWNLRSGRTEGIDRMIAAVSESLEVDRGIARHLVLSLASSGLIDFERTGSLPAPMVGPPPAGKTPPPSMSQKEPGTWHIGPRL